MTHALTTTTPPCCNPVRDYVRRDIRHDAVTNHYRCATCGRAFTVTVLLTVTGKKASE